MDVRVSFDYGSALPFMNAGDDYDNYYFTDTEPPTDCEDGAEEGEDDFYIPTWMGTSHGFRDVGRLREEEAVAVLERHVPSDVAEWDYYCDDQSWRVPVAGGRGAAAVGGGARGRSLSGARGG